MFDRILNTPLEYTGSCMAYNYFQTLKGIVFRIAIQIYIWDGLVFSKVVLEKTLEYMAIFLM